MIAYDSADTVAGQLQRGLGRGARVVRDPALVEACLRQQYAWDWQVDSRDVYLARLVRDLGLPVQPILARLHAAEPEFTVALGSAAVPAARRWAATGGPLRQAAISTLAAHGDDTDVPVLLAEVARLDSTPDRLCGYDELVTGLARIGGPVVVILRRLWLTPHSCERASYLRAYRIADPAVAESLFVEGLWDCEESVRRVAAEHVVLEAETRERLSYLRDDPMEDAGVRGAAAAWLES